MPNDVPVEYWCLSSVVTYADAVPFAQMSSIGRPSENMPNTSLPDTNAETLKFTIYKKCMMSVGCKVIILIMNIFEHNALATMIVHTFMFEHVSD